MIRQSIKHFFTHLKYVFTPLGTLFLGIVFSFTLFIPGLLEVVRHLVNEVNQVSQNTQLDVSALYTTIVDSIAHLDWSNYQEAIQTMFSDDWFAQCFYDAITQVIGENSVYIEQITALIQEALGQLIVLTIVGLFFILVGLISGILLTKLWIRRAIARRKLWKYVIITLIDTLLNVTLISLCLWFVGLWLPSGLLFTLFSLLLSGAVALFEAYLVHGWKKVSFKSIVTMKNIIQLCISNSLIAGIAIVMILILGIVFNGVVAFVCGIGLFTVATSIVNLNAEAYVKQLTQTQDV
ncbi:MAG: hypothetical protein NC182_04975 [Prevotella sp.]|nr:hypothetical protein [Staphylococcus sp.]MCM1350536.1 hypothetical protein [Prevotella sp.]